MKNTGIYFALALYLLCCYNCKDIIFIPKKGSISGYVSDNNGTPLSGIQVSAVYNAPSQAAGQPPVPTTITVSTDNTGFYQVSDLWDDVVLNINAAGFLPATNRIDLNDNDAPNLDFYLTGSPTIEGVILSKNTLSSSYPDTVVLSMEVRDVFNGNNQGYTGNFLLKADNDTKTIIIPATLLLQSLEKYQFESVITAGNIPDGIFQLLAEVQDPDGNMHQINTEQRLYVQ